MQPDQKTRFLDLLERCRRDTGLALSRGIFYDRMEAVLAEAQNSPPDGGADRSFDEGSWTEARDMLRHLREAERLEAELRR